MSEIGLTSPVTPNQCLLNVFVSLEPCYAYTYFVSVKRSIGGSYSFNYRNMGVMVIRLFMLFHQDFVEDTIKIPVTVPLYDLFSFLQFLYSEYMWDWVGGTRKVGNHLKCKQIIYLKSKKERKTMCMISWIWGGGRPWFKTVVVTLIIKSESVIEAKLLILRSLFIFGLYYS